ncbi:unnamed protein product [Brassica rapa subsp. trilocularis]|uniref:(rape) hypothetical protein n=1 Tax=Brassica napus TaxID=3708 RepID=A0A817A601_BRANA|nr:unnamed protein product [Brassica napus]
MISVVIITGLLVEYTAALAKLTAGIIPRRQGDSNVVRVGGFVLSCPSPWSTNRSSPIPDFSSHLKSDGGDFSLECLYALSSSL